MSLGVAEAAVIYSSQTKGKKLPLFSTHFTFVAAHIKNSDVRVLPLLLT